MVEMQVLSKVLNNKDISLITNNNLTEDYFLNYVDEYNFILNHYARYGNVPDLETFLDKFPDFQVVKVSENDEYLITTIREEAQYAKTVPIINKVADLLQTNAYDAVDYLRSVLPTLDISKDNIGANIIKNATDRYNEYLERANGNNKLLSTGFLELDEIVGGLNRGEEFVVIVARTGEGKTWVLLKMLEELWKNKLSVGLIEPEMSYNKIGYRFDTLNANISNTSLLRGNDNIDYKPYIDRLNKNKTPFDGISYLRDERGKKSDNKTTSLTNISEDLMNLSISLGIPIICVVQSNRTGAGTENAPELDSIRDSDGIAYNASMILAIKQKEPGIEIVVRKNRNGMRDGKVLYAWDIDKGKFIYVPSNDDSVSNDEQIQTQRKRFRDRSEAI